MEKIKRIVDRGYRAIEGAVVGTYRRIEAGAVTGFAHVSDWCIGKLFAREGESVEQAKARLTRKP